VSLFNVQVRIAPPAPDQRLTWVQNVRVEAGNPNRAKGLAALQTQTANPGRGVEVVDCWEVFVDPRGVVRECPSCQQDCTGICDGCWDAGVRRHATPEQIEKLDALDAKVST
jgi:hypothetical protein